MSALIPTITAHHQMQLVARGFDIQHKVIEHKGAAADEFTVEFPKATRRFRFFFGFGQNGILSMHGLPVFVVSKKDPAMCRRSDDWAAEQKMDAFFQEIGFQVVRSGHTWTEIHPIKKEVAA